jgi:hypothetical protein
VAAKFFVQHAVQHRRTDRTIRVQHAVRFPHRILRCWSAACEAPTEQESSPNMGIGRIRSRRETKLHRSLARLSIAVGCGLALVVAVAFIAQNVLRREQPTTSPLAPSAPLAEQPVFDDHPLLDDLQQQRVARPSSEAPHLDTGQYRQDMPVTLMLELFGPSARAGDRVSACRLARALHACRRSPVRPAIEVPSLPDEAATMAFVNVQAALHELQESRARSCRDLGPEHFAQSTRFLATAALAGHRDSLLAFVDAPMQWPADFMRDPELAHLYRTRLWPVIAQAIRSGEQRVLMQFLASIMRADQSALAAAVPARYRDSEAARALSNMLRSTEVRELIAELAPNEPEVDPAAAAMAREWAEELLGDRHADSSTVFDRADSVQSVATDVCTDQAAYVLH